MDYLYAILAGYALGAPPFACWLASLRGVDLTRLGTGNPGAANLFRQVSRPLGVLAIGLDGAKGALAVLAGGWIGLSDGATLVPGVAAVVGHMHSPFLGFRGGAGLATTLGVGLAASPLAGPIAFSVGVTATLLGRNVGRGSGYGWALYVIIAPFLGERWYVIVGIVGLGAALLVRALLLERLRDR
jgi:glycerol-3-phosphate acyltransferase PlsY